MHYLGLARFLAVFLSSLVLSGAALAQDADVTGAIRGVVPSSRAQSQAQNEPIGRRVALVVGNSAYRNVNPLANPDNDAILIASTLKEAGFTLVGGQAQIDLDKPHFDQMVHTFGQLLTSADVALFYYSGHGMQVAGENWLVPIDANPTRTQDLDFQMVNANLVLRQMEGASTRLNLVILDACRNNPFASRGLRATGGGLAEMRAPDGTLISYATQPGNVAADGVGNHSPYTTALADAIHQPGMDVFQVFNNVGLAVKQVTGGNQQPWVATSPIAGNFYFFSGPVTISPPPTLAMAPAPPEADTVFWQAVAQSADKADYELYLQSFPTGRFAELARRRIAAIQNAAKRSISHDEWSPDERRRGRLSLRLLGLI